MSEENGLPPGWAIATLDDFITERGKFCDGDWVESEDQDPSGEVRLIQLADVGDGVFRDRSNRFLTSQKALELGCTFLKEGDVLIARMPDPLGRAAIFPGSSHPCVTVVDVCIVRSGPGGVNHRWLMWFVNALQFRARVAALQSGSTRQRISRKNLATIRLPIPPLQEQARIVSTVEEFLSDVDAGVAALERARANLKKYRAAVLKAAVTGDLTADWRAAHPNTEPANKLLDRMLVERRRKWEAGQLAKFNANSKTPSAGWQSKYVEDNRAQNEGMPSLPSGWSWGTIGQVAADTLIGLDRGRLYQRSELPGTGYVKMNNVTTEGQVVWNDLVYIDATAEERLRYSLRTGDLLFNTRNSKELVGKTGVVGTLIEEAIFNNNLMRIRVAPGINPHFLCYQMCSDPFRSRMEQVKKATTNIAAVYGSDLVGLPIAIPPTDEQTAIVAEVEQQLSVIAAARNYIEASLKRSGRLRQSILKEAFAGRLVPQDPNHEPASVLLERIRTASIKYHADNAIRPRLQGSHRKREGR